MQTAHVVAEFAIEHEGIFKAWKHGSNYLCCLESKELDDVIQYLRSSDLKFTEFYEPDVGMITAVAVEPKGNHIFNHLKLAS